MKKSLRFLPMTIALLATVAAADSQQAADPRVADLVTAGRIRIALHLGQFTKDPVTGELRGMGPGVVFMDIARALSARLGVETILVGHPTPAKLVECVKAGACDVGIVGIEPSRAAEVDFSPPFTQFDYTYLVPTGCPIRSVADADGRGVRIAVVRNHTSTLALGRILKHAEMVGAEIPEAAFDLLRTGRADALAAPRPQLLEYSTKLAGSRVLDDRYGANLGTAMVIPKGQPGRLAYVSEFIEEAKASGFVQRAIERAGERGIRVAPPGNPTAQK
jgi:polar amino acid transport system substrate-binding protein